MSSSLLRSVAVFVRDLLSYDEQLIRIGRQNFERTNFETGYIIIDALAPSARVGSSEQYDGDAESQALSDHWRGTVTIDFYGSNAYTRATEFCARCRGQQAYEPRVSTGVDVHRPSGITDVAALTGQQYGELVQVECVVEHMTAVAVDTLRIDTAQTEIRNESGVQYNG